NGKQRPHEHEVAQGETDDGEEIREVKPAAVRLGDDHLTFRSGLHVQPEAPVAALRVQRRLAEVERRRRAPIGALVAPHVVVLDRPTLRRHGPVGRKLGLHARPACGTILFPGQRLPPRVFRETETRDIAYLLHPENRCQRHRRARLPAAHSRPAPRTAARGPPLPAAFFGRRNAVRPGRLRRGRQLIQGLVHFAKQPLELRPFAIRLQQAEKLGAHFRFSRRPYRRGFHGTDLRAGPSADFVLLPTRFYTVRRNPAFSGAVSRAGPPGARRRVSLRSPT